MTDVSNHHHIFPTNEGIQL